MLPIYDIADRLVDTLRASNRLVLSAPTGSGKTTQVPQILLRSGIIKGQIIVLQPRRLAARLVASRVASEMKVSLGQEVGYQTRHDSRISSKTVIRFMTEGLFIRVLQSQPRLPGIDAVILDEFHERNLPADVSLAMVRRLQESSRPDLRMIVMSATLDVQQVSGYLSCPSLEAGGRAFPVDVHYMERRIPSGVGGGFPGAGAPWELAADALAAVLDRGEDGDVLIFMPGAYEIRRTIEACRRVAGDDVALFPLHGELPVHEQDAALAPNAKRRVIVSTNIAETSITIDGVCHVIDSGLARVNRFDPRRGLNVLLVEPISQASAEQRAGRAGRTAPGTCYRLWPQNEHRSRPAHDTPEIRRLDLAEVLLQLMSFGVRDPAAFGWLEPPETLAVSQALGVLQALGAIDATGALSQRGARMATLPMHPRLAAMLLEASRRGYLDRATLWAAFISDRDILLRNPPRELLDSASIPGTQHSDFVVLENAFAIAKRLNFDPARCAPQGVNGLACREVERTRQLFMETCEGLGKSDAETTRRQDAEKSDLAPFIKSLLTGFPDHVAVRRGEGNLACALVGNRRGVLDGDSVAKHVGLLLPVEMREVGAFGKPVSAPGKSSGHGVRKDVQTVLSLVSELDPAWLRELFPDRVTVQHVTTWNADMQAVERVEQHAFDGLVFDQTARPETDLHAAAGVLAEQVFPTTSTGAPGKASLRLEHWNEEVEQWIARTRCVAQWFPERKLITYDDDDLRVVLAEICAGAVRYSQVKDRPVLAKVKDALSWEDQQFVEKMAPDRIQLPRGWRMKVEYPATPGNPPRGRAKIQDFYDLNQTPTIAAGRVKLTLEILGPNRRPLQLTNDLAGFWANLYPTLRKELSRKYPRQEWR